VSPTQRLAVWMYERPGLRRAWLICCGSWFGAIWALAAAPAAAADPYAPTGPSIASGQFLAAWTGLHDSYGVPVADYFISTVSPSEALAHTAQSAFSWDPASWAPAIVSTIWVVLSNVLGSGVLAIECSILLFIGALGIWLIKFALSAPWLSWLATLATPFVNNLNVMIGQLYVIPIALLVCCGIGGVVALTKGWGHGLGMILGGFFVILLIYVLFREPVHDLIGPDGVLGIGQYLGFMVAEGAVHNGPLAPGGSSASLDTLTSLLCDVLLREPIQMINFNAVVDDVPSCANAWSTAIMSGEISAPAHAMKSCGDPAGLAFADQLGLAATGAFLMVILVEVAVMLALVYIAFNVILIGFKAFGNALVLVVAAPLAVAPGPTRRYARRKVSMLFTDGVEMFVTIVGLAIVVIIQGEVTSGTMPGLTGMATPLAKLVLMLLLSIAGALVYHQMLVSFRHGDSRIRNFGRRLAEFGGNVKDIDYLSVTATGRSLSGWRRRRWYHDPQDSDLWPGPDFRNRPGDERRWDEWRPGRTPPLPPGAGGRGNSGAGNGGSGSRGAGTGPRLSSGAGGVGGAEPATSELTKTRPALRPEDAVAGGATGHAAEHQPAGRSYSPGEVIWDWPSNQQPLPLDPDPGGHFEPPANPPGGRRPPPEPPAR
jgi:hypothetical protein